MKRHILCLGDSNTHGYCADPADCADGGNRFNEEERWTCLLQKALGDRFLVLEEGLCGRTCVYDDPTEEGLNTLSYIVPCLKSHLPVTLLVVMLGTNDLRSCYGASPLLIARGMERLLKAAETVPCWEGGKPHILLIPPAPLSEEAESHPVSGPILGPGSAEKSLALPSLYRETAARWGWDFFDPSGLISYSPADYMHLTKESHGRLAAALSPLIIGLV